MLNSGFAGLYLFRLSTTIKKNGAHTTASFRQSGGVFMVLVGIKRNK